METWVVLSLSAMVLWSLQAVLLKMGMPQSNIFTYFVFSALITLLLVVPSVKLLNEPLRLQPNIFLILAIVASFSAFVLFLLAVRIAEVSRVVAITSLYVVLAGVLSYFFLGEPITVRKLLAIFLAFFAILLLT